MDVEVFFLTKLLLDGDYAHVTDHSINERHFADPDNKKVFEFIYTYFGEHTAVPPLSVVKARFPGRSWPASARNHQMSYLGEELRKVVLHGDLKLAMADTMQLLNDGQPINAYSELNVALQKMTAEAVVMHDLDVNATWLERLDRYRLARSNPGIQGIPTGFKTIDKATLGLMRQQLIVLIGLAKAGKSALLIAMADYAQRAGYKVLFIGFEMSNDEQTARLDAQRAHVDHMRILSGEMTPDDEDRLIKAGERYEDLPEFTMTEDPVGMTTVSAVAAKIAAVKPDICIIDGVYLMDDELGEAQNSEAALRNISRGLKRVAQRYDIPLVVTTQALESKVDKRRGLTAGATGYTSAFNQDCSVMLGIEMDNSGQQKLSTLLSRNGPRAWCNVRWDWSTSTFEERMPEHHDDEEDEKEVEERQYDEDTSAPPSARRKQASLIEKMRSA